MGALQRDGQLELSKACGAAVGAYKAVLSKRIEMVDGIDKSKLNKFLLQDDKDNDPFDPQLKIIIDLLMPRLEGIEGSPDPIAFVTYQMYAVAAASPNIVLVPIALAALRHCKSERAHGVALDCPSNSAPPRPSLQVLHRA